MRKIILPQAVPIIIPPTGNQFIAMLKDSSLVSVLGVWELMYLAKTLGQRDFRHMEMLLTAAMIYWGLNIILLTIVLYLLWKNRNAKHPNPTKKSPVLSTHEIAFRELDTLKNKGLLECGNAREHFFELSEILRRYLGKRYLFPALDWTTEEITEHFKNQEKIKRQSR